jgi:hypothetical protein
MYTSDIYEFYGIIQYFGEELNYSLDLINFSDTEALRISTNNDISGRNRCLGRNHIGMDTMYYAGTSTNESLDQQ